MQLDRRVGDYAAAIVRDVDLLLADVSNLTAEQQAFAASLKLAADRFLSTFNAHVMDFTELTHEAIVIVHDLRNPIGLIEGYCELLLTRKPNNLTPSQTEHLQQIKSAHDFIFNTFTKWVNSQPLT